MNKSSLFVCGAAAVLVLTWLAGASGAAQAQSTPAHTASCRAPQSTKKKPDQAFAFDSPQGQADDWAAWMNEQLGAGKTQFVVVPI